MVEDKSTQDEVLKSGKVDTIISEPIGVMLLHERMVRLSGRRVDVTLSLGWPALTPGRVIHPCPRHVLEARRTDAAVGRTHFLRAVHGRGAVQ